MTNKLIAENMSTSLITIGWNERIESAYRRMQAQRIRHLPVVNESREIVGMLSDRDVQRAMISEVYRPTGQVASDEVLAFDEDSLVRDYMSWPAKSIDRSSDLKRVAERMMREKVSSFLVTDQQAVVGIVTAEDLIRVLIELLGDSGTSPRMSLSDLLAESGKMLDGVLI